MYGELTNLITGGNHYKPEVPDPSNVTGDFLGMVNGYAQGMPTMLATEQQYKPQFVQQDLQNLYTAMWGRNSMPGYAREMALANPTGDAILGQLSSSAQEQLGAGASLDPALQKVTEQGIRGSQAARGLGYGPADAMEESVGLTQLGNQLRQERQGFATQVQQLNQGRADRLLNASMGLGSNASPTLFPSNQAYDAFNTAYNARAASNIAGANNRAAVDSSY